MQRRGVRRKLCGVSHSGVDAAHLSVVLDLDGPARRQRDLDATRENAALSPITAAMMDAAGVLHVVMRSGERLEVRVADFDALVAARVSEALGEAESAKTLDTE